MNITSRIVNLNNCEFEVTEDNDRIYFKEISNRKNKAHFSFSKNSEDNAEAKFGLRTFFTEVFS